ncbi:MAG TPA: SDR family oxidoreductase [Burkholderiales bacterium]|nr:SDR family oxidoreductase [Burkholderiales bacterium]
MARTIFITGASSGIGAALAAHYAREGAALGLVARRKDLLDDLARTLGVACATYAADVADAPALRAAAEDFVSRHGLPDVVVANAGISVGTSGAEAEDVAVLDRVLRTNVVGLAATFQPFVAPMRARGAGILAGIASVAGFRGLPGAGAYSASKAGAIAWLESLRVELTGTGVAVVTVCPGYVDTPMTRVNRHPMPFLLSSEDGARRIARAIDARRSLTVVPWQMAIVGWLMRRLPNRLYDALSRRSPRKPRKLPL